MAKTLAEQVKALKAQVRSLKARIKEMEDDRAKELTSAIGFEVTPVEMDDESEYRRKGRK